MRSIDANSNLKILKLAGCVNITGSGLDLLRSSVAIQQIDMSLIAKHESPILEPEPSLSENVVISILDDIISRGRSSLKQLELPKKWRDAQSTDMDQFLDRYEVYMRSQRYCCSKCDRVFADIGGDKCWICRGGGDEDASDIDNEGTQNFTCSKCLNHFCDDDNCMDGDHYHSGWCKNCEKEYCKSCVAMTECVGCGHDFCNECVNLRECEVEVCEEVFCDVCAMGRACHHCNQMRCRTCIMSYKCYLDGCNKAICAECVRSEGDGGRCQVLENHFALKSANT